MLELPSLLKQIRCHCYSETKNHIDLIVEQNSRIENYYSVLIIILLAKLKSNNKIIDYKFQYLLTNDKRKHIDFLISGKNFKAFVEIKHLAVDIKEKVKNNRSINFYTNKSGQGKKVGIVGDLEKLNNTNKNTITDLISFSIVTNPPDKKIINERIKYLLKQEVSKNWKINEYSSESVKLSFIVCSKSLTKPTK